jgi:hypothetical protein
VICGRLSCFYKDGPLSCVAAWVLLVMREAILKLRSREEKDRIADLSPSNSLTQKAAGAGADADLSDTLLGGQGSASLVPSSVTQSNQHVFWKRLHYRGRES